MSRIEHTSPVVAIHGVSRGDSSGFSVPLQKEVLFFANGMTPIDLDWREVVWSDLAKDEALHRLGDLGAVLFDYSADVLSYADEFFRRKVITRLDAQIRAHQEPVLLVAHSLGSVVAIDYLTALLQQGAFNKPPQCWPVHALLTIGSPLGIDVPLAGVKAGFLDRNEALLDLEGLPGFRWTNIFDRDDPVVTGSIFDKPYGEPHLSAFEGYQKLNVLDFEVDAGICVVGHIGYWRHSVVAQHLYDLLFPLHGDTQ